MGNDMDVEGALALVQPAGDDDAEMQALGLMSLGRKVGAAIDRQTAQVRQAEELAVQRDRDQAGRLDRLAGAVESVSGQLSSLAERLTVLEERQAEAARCAAVESEARRVRGEGTDAALASLSDRLEGWEVADEEWRKGEAEAAAGRHDEVTRALGEVLAVLAMLPEAYAAVVSSVREDVGSLAGDFRRHGAFVGRRLVELETGAAEAVSSLRGVLLGAVEAEGERADARHEAQAAALEALDVLAREQFAGVCVERAEDRGVVDAARDEVVELRRLLGSAEVTVTSAVDASRDALLGALEAAEGRAVERDQAHAEQTETFAELLRVGFAGAAEDGAATRLVVEAARGELGDVRSAVDSATVTATAATDTARDEVLAAVAAQGEVTGAAVVGQGDRLARELDQAARVVAGVAVSVDGVKGDVLDVHQAIAVDAAETRALVQGAAEESARLLVQLGEDQAARADVHHQEVTGALGDLRSEAGEALAAVRSEAKVRHTETSQRLDSIAGDGSALLELLAEVPAQVQRAVEPSASSTARACEVLERQGAQMLDAFGRRADELISKGNASEYARDKGVVELGRRVVRLEDRTGLASEAVTV